MYHYFFRYRHIGMLINYNNYYITFSNYNTNTNVLPKEYTFFISNLKKMGLNKFCRVMYMSLLFMSKF